MIIYKGTPIRPSADFKQKPCKQKGMAGYIQNMKEKLPTKNTVLDNVIQIWRREKEFSRQSKDK